MKMGRLFACLIGFVAGVALSAGSAFAQTNGYTVGDQANMKLVPHYETDDMKATIIGIQNMSPQEASTKALHLDVADLEAYLRGDLPSTTPEPNIRPDSATDSQAKNINSLIQPEDTSAPVDVSDPKAIDKNDLNAVAAAEKALADANAAVVVEHMFITVNVYDAMGMAMKEEETDKVLSSATLCLAENQFGVVVLQGAMAAGAGSLKMRTLSVADGDIAEYGFVEIMAGTKKYDGCVAATPDGLNPVDDDTDGTNALGPTDNEVAAWTIIQDIGAGFFGTEVPTATVSMSKKTGEDAKDEVACYTAPDANSGSATQAPFTEGAFMTGRCGLIPERHNIGVDADTDGSYLDEIDSTENATVTARYDIGDETMVYVWLAKGMDTEDTLPRDERMLEVSVICEDGMMPAGADADGDNQPDPIKVAAPTMVTLIDPAGDELGPYTDQCEGDRGVLSMTMPNGSHAGMVFTHITQMMAHYRMNFPGYSMASTTACTADSATECN